MKTAREVFISVITIFILLMVVQGCSVVHMKGTSSNGHTGQVSAIVMSDTSNTGMVINELDVKVSQNSDASK